MAEWDGLSTRFGIRAAAVSEAAPEYPAPLVTERLAMPGEVPATAVRAWEAAVAAGWRGRITYACGYMPHAIHGTPGKRPKESIAVRLQAPDGRRVVGLWLDRAWEKGWEIFPTLRRLSAAEFQEMVTT